MNDTPENRDHVIHQVKRTRWQQKGGGEEYQFYAYKNDPITRLKNISEISFVLRNATGPSVLDAGAGTGRFTLPLREKGFDAIGIDISREMLAQGVKHSKRNGTPFSCLIGDIERLPFADDRFDTVVSITVLRHFPRWPDILREYVRVLRPGGRVIFDMASGEQRAYLASRGWAPNTASDPIAFEAALGVCELRRVAAELGLSIVLTTPYDFFHVNDVLRFAFGDNYDEFQTRLAPVMNTPGALAFCEAVTRGAFPYLSPALTSSWLIVLEKTEDTCEAAAPPYRAARSTASAGDPSHALLGLIQACAGRNAAKLMADTARLLRDPDAARFLDFCRSELLPRFPLEAACWEREG